jgi:hypothetical protein
MTMRIVAVMGFGAGRLPAAAGEPRQKAQVTKTERIDFPAGGTPRLANSIGVLTVEAWDRPGVEITTEKAAHQMESAHVAAERRGNEFVATDCPRHGPFPPPNILDPLPEEGRYDIHAKSKFGDVNNDFPGEERRRWWVVGHRIAHQDSPAPHKLDLRVKFGDIVILKTRVPKSPEPLIPASKSEAYE